MDAVASESGTKVMNNTEVQSVSFDNDAYTVTTTEGEFQSPVFGIAAPPSAAAAVTRDSFPELSALLAKIKMTAVESVGVVIKKDASSVSPVAGIISKDDIFYSAVSRDTVRDDSFRGFTFHFRPGVDEDTKLRRIRDVLGVEGFIDVAQSSAVLPSPVLGHSELMSDVDRLLEGKRLLLTGNYFSGLAIEDCVIRSAEEFQRLKRLMSA
jgi:protoporphyrinogen oxidase